MRSFTRSLLLALSVCNLLWSGAASACTSEITCPSAFIGRSSIPSAMDIGKRQLQGLTNAERLRKRLPLLPPSRVARHNQDPGPSSLPKDTHSGTIGVFEDDRLLGYVSVDKDTPQLKSDATSALKVSFQLDQGKTSGSQLLLTQLNDPRGNFLGAVVGPHSTTSDIGPGNFNYLYLTPVFTKTAPGSTPQSVPGLDKQAETSVWRVDLTTGALDLQWINSDSSTPSTVVFVQSNKVYAGGDRDAFGVKFPDPVTPVTLKFIPTT